MALYNTPWGPRELPDDEATELRGQVGADAITLADGEPAPVSLDPTTEGA